MLTKYVILEQVNRFLHYKKPNKVEIFSSAETERNVQVSSYKSIHFLKRIFFVESQKMISGPPG